MAPSTPMKKTMKAIATTPMKKAGGASLSKGGLAEAVAAATGHKKAEVSKVLDALAAIGTKEVKSHGVFTVPGPPPATSCCVRVDVCCSSCDLPKTLVVRKVHSHLSGLARIKTRVKPATKAGKRTMFGKARHALCTYTIDVCVAVLQSNASR